MTSALVVALLFASAPVFAGTWTDLWLTPDQQGQRLLDAGEAGKAAQQFQDPRLSAYADAKAGNYDSAAERLAPLKDVDSLYNRGNALARAGKLKEALGAYDAALAKVPNDRDARHNRDLVERQLQKQNNAQQNGNGKSGSNGQDGSGQRGQGQQGQGQGQQGQGQQQSGSQPNGSQQNGSQGSGAQPGEEQRSRAEGDQRQNGGQQGAGQNGKSPGASDGSARAGAPVPGGTNNGSDRDVAAAAQQTNEQQAAAAHRDAEAALQRGGKQPGAVAGSQENQQPTSEQALAREQWLRQIPEDPGGLLRRKFMVEHMKKQQQESQQ